MNRNRNAAIAAAMTALSHPRRVAIYDVLCAAPRPGLSFDALLAATRLNRSTLGHHLRPMLAAGLVRRRRKGREVLHFPQPAALTPAFSGVEAIAGAKVA